MNNLTYSLNFLFKSLIKNVSPFLSYGNDSNGPLWLAMQDHVGTLWCAPQQITKEKAAIWFNFLKKFPFRSLLMNVELYKFDCSTGAIYPADLAEVQAREAYYMRQGIPLGPSFELRFWGAYSHN
uniref:Uncharacterized protein n=1 Tax=Acrobeloides nanus TaxID=290746 RepID=A0A914EI94_9BILA